jgi:hypothetical protein
VDWDQAIDDVVLFDVAWEADDLCDRLRGDRLVWSILRDGRRFVATDLRRRPDDLAILLREVESWLAERGGRLLRFVVDGRTYTLRPMPSLASAAVPLH